MRGRWGSLVIGLAVLAVLVGGWQAYIEIEDVSPFVLPPPADVVRATWELLGEGDTWHHLWVTLSEILLGFAVATVVGIGIGALLGELPVLDRALTPFLVALQVLPKVAVIPLFILWFGFGSTSKVVVAAIFGLFPIVAGTQAGIRSVEPGHRDLAATLNTRARHRLVLFDLPSALPSILTGMEVGIVLATIGTVVAEYLAGSEGLGWMAVSLLNQLRVDSLFGVIAVLSALGFALHAGVVVLRRLLVPWHQSAATPRSPW
jgi:NitT/TauT family transport system permease protein